MNTIRVPKQGVTAGSRRIAQAVDNQEWQEFRLSMKGKPTKVKLAMLGQYYTRMAHRDLHTSFGEQAVDITDCDICIRVHNYITALARGGQLYSGVSLKEAMRRNFNLKIQR